jgi:hypothetical protein
VTAVAAINTCRSLDEFSGNIQSGKEDGCRPIFCDTVTGDSCRPAWD